MDDLVWTTEKPTKPGWYWFRNIKAKEKQHRVKECVCRVKDYGLLRKHVAGGPMKRWRQEGLFVKRGAHDVDIYGDSPTMFQAEWAGPVEIPSEPTS